MTLKRFSFLLLSSLLLSMTLLLVSIYYFLYLPSIKHEILDQQQQEYNLLQSALSLSKKNLTTLCYDYGVWDELAEYVNNPNDDFPQSNIPENGLEAANIDAVYIHDTNHRLVWDYQHESLNRIHEKLQKIIVNKGQQGLSILPDELEISTQLASSRNAYLVLDGHLLYLSNTTILPSMGKGEIVGSITMIRLVDEFVIAEASRFSLVDFSVSANGGDDSSQSLDEFFTSNSFTNVAASHSWVIRNSFDTQAVVVTIQHKKVTPTQLDWFAALLLLLFISLIILVSLMMLSKFLITPLIKFNLSINESSENEFTVKMPSFHFIDEIENVSHSFNELLLKIKIQKNYLETLTIQDALTGITNRRGLEFHADKVLTTWREKHLGFSLMMIDVDQFKQFNDHNGHLAGDNALVDVATCLMKTISGIDALVTRYGGEEFCIIASSNNLERIAQLGEHLRQAVERLQIPHDVDDCPWLTISIGVLVVPDNPDTDKPYSFLDLLQLADEQLYLAKQAGRNRVMETRLV
jgi:diguanylate cyclase (GGDEF)-like protein